MNLKNAIGLLSALACGTLVAADAIDLSSADVWADKTAIKELTTPNSTYTALQDFGYSGRLFLEADGIVLDMTEETSGSASRTISPTRSSQSILLYNGSKARSVRAQVKGGVWDFGKVGGFNIGNTTTYNGTLVLTNQCVFKDVKGVYFQGSANGSNELVVAGQSQLLLSAGTGGTAAEGVLFQMGDVTSGLTVDNQHNTLRICEGSTVSVDGQFLVEAGTVTDAQLTGNHSIIVSGTGSSFSVVPSCTDKAKRYFSTGRSRGNRVFFTDHAQGHFQHYVYHGDGTYASDNLFTVEKGAAVTVEGTGAFVIGKDTTKADKKNTLLVRDGGSFSCKTAYVGGLSASKAHFAEIIVSNATFACTTLQLGQGYSNRVEVCGSDAHFNAGTDASANVFGIFAAGGYNELVIRDQAVWSPTRKVRFCADYGFSSNNVMTVTEGAGVDASQDFMIGGNDGNIPAQVGWCHSNRLVVSDDAEFSTDGSLLFYSNDNGLEISNATVSAAAVTMYNSNRSVITLRGGTPRLQVTGALSLTRNAKLGFEIPSEGYAADFVPVTANSLTLDSTTELRVSVSEQFLKDNLKRRSIPLAVATTLTVNADVLAAANANLPPKCSLSVVTQADGKKALCLSVPGNSGLMILLR